MTTFVIPQPKAEPATMAPSDEAKHTGPVLVPLAVFHAHKVCTQQASRYRLGGICFESINGRPYAISSDGARLVVMSWNPSDGEQLDAIVSATAFDAACRAMEAAGSNNINECGEVSADAVSVAWYDGSAVTCKAPALKGRFPRWQEVIPAVTAEHRTVAFNSRLLRELLEVFEAVGGSNHPYVRFTVPADNSPCLITLATGNVCVCAVLATADVSGDGMGSGPAWLPLKANT